MANTPPSGGNKSNAKPAAKQTEKVVTAAPVAPTPPAAPVVAAVADDTPAPVAVSASVESVADIVVPTSDVAGDDGDDAAETHALVVKLNEHLDNFVQANKAVGTEPKNFKQSAVLAMQLTRFVIRHPKVPVLNALLAFFKENLEGVCRGENFMKGSTLLSTIEEQKVGALYNLFYALADNQTSRFESTQIVKVLEKPEFVSFYNRRLTMILKNK